jgi:glutaminyl-tRNA synthetase
VNTKTQKTAAPAAPASTSNFIRSIIEHDLAAGKHAARGDWAKIRTRFPPEPNGYLHYGHAKSICLNFGLARDFGGVCHLRFDDTNPTKEEQEYVDSIIDTVHWLGFSWDANGASHQFFASNYFDKLYAFAEHLVSRGLAYVDSQSAEEMRASRGTLTQGGRNSPFRDRSVEENLRLLGEMKAGKHPDGSHILRAKIDMESPNINMRDPAMYRIRHAHHHRTGDAWCLYPTYDWAHGVSDAIEHITHSVCTLEFQDHRPLYDWFNQQLADGGQLDRPLPQQIEFARLNLTYVVLSKRKLIQLVEEQRVDGWDDPRLATLVGARRRGYTPEGFRAFAERIGVSKADSWIDISVLEDCVREHLNEVAPRRIAVLDPLKLVIENYPEGREELCEAPNHPQKPELGKRPVPFSRELWIEREDYQEVPPKGYFRLFPGNKVRLRYGFVLECIGYDATTDTVRCKYFEDSKSGTPGADTYKVKGNIHWLSAKHSHAAEVRLYDRLFKVPHPGAGDTDFLKDINPESKKVISAQLEPALAEANAEDRFQFERHGYFVADRVDSKPGAPVFNRTVTLRDSWAK